MTSPKYLSAGCPAGSAVHATVPFRTSYELSVVPSFQRLATARQGGAA